jgi:hypothetical protein
MNSADAANEWDLVVPGDDAELPTFFASFDGPADLAERSGEILRSEFPGA